MAKTSQIDKMVAILESEIEVREFAIAKLLESQSKAKAKAKTAPKPRIVAKEQAG